MEIPPVKTPVLPEVAADQAKGKSKAGEGKIDLKGELNAKIIAAHKEVSISARDNDLMLVYKAAIDKLNEILEPTLGEGGIEAADPEDYTPDAVSERIVDFATSFFESYKTQNPGMSEEEALDSYMEIIKGAIDQGFGEAREILDGLKVLEGDIADNIDKTYELVQKGLEKFVEGRGGGTDTATVEQ